MILCLKEIFNEEHPLFNKQWTKKNNSNQCKMLLAITTLKQLSGLEVKISDSSELFLIWKVTQNYVRDREKPRRQSKGMDPTVS